LDFLN